MILAPSSSIWTPRNGPWWRLPKFLDFFATEGKLQRDPTTGKLKRNSSGKIVRSSATNNACCCEAGEPCDDCVNSMPETIELSLSVGAICTGCYAIGFSFWKVFSGSPDGVYTLPQLANPCVYQLAVTGQFLIRRYSNGTCTTLVSTHDEFFVNVSRVSGNWILNVATGLAPTGPHSIFYDTIIDVDCNGGSLGLSNDITTCMSSGANFSFSICTGGTATLLI